MTHNGAPEGNRHGLKWTAEQDAMLKDLFDRSFSFSQIAAKMGTDLGTGYSRNAVLGRAHRLQLLNGGKMHKPTVCKEPVRTHVRFTGPPAPRKRYPAAISPEVAQMRCDRLMPRHLALVELGAGDCRYPFGEGPFRFCGHPKLEFSSYCLDHHCLTRKLPGSAA